MEVFQVFLGGALASLKYALLKHSNTITHLSPSPYHFLLSNDTTVIMMNKLIRDRK